MAVAADGEQGSIGEQQEVYACRRVGSSVLDKSMPAEGGAEEGGEEGGGVRWGG
jgi:hypothetical protein